MAHDIHRFAVIMAGGAGERFWPLSRADRPKQLLHLTDPDRSMLAEAVDRLTGIIPPERIYVITSESLTGVIREANVGVPPENIVAEPGRRNTGGALVYIAAHILAKHPMCTPAEISLAVVTADHKIGAVEKFRASVDAALRAAETQPALVICGIPPDSPETGFGYVQVGAPVELERGFFRVAAFHEKPSRERAEDFLAQGDCYWNSGMFFWTLATFLDQLERVRPEMASAVTDMATALQQGDAAAVRERFELLPNLSIDYALMEHAEEVLMLPADFPWRDVGLWAHLDHLHAPDAEGNSAVGDPVLFDSHDCIVYNAPGARQVAVGIAGLRDIIVAVTEDAVLVVPKDRAQDVRHIVAELKKRNAPQV